MEEIDEEIDKEITKVSQRILESFPDIKQKINPEPYHFIEICIMFSEYCDDLTISKDDFIAANKIFSDDEDSEDINNSKDELFTKIYHFISGDNTNNSMPLYALFGYLRIISITEKINNEILFKILDRKEKGSIEFDNIETLISNLEDFLDSKEDWNDFIDSFKGKKLTMRNLSQGDFASKIKKLFYLAEIKIFDMAKKSFEANELNNNNNNKEEENINNNNINIKTRSRKSSSDMSSSKAISRRSIKNLENDDAKKNNNKKQLILNLQDDNDNSMMEHNNNKNKKIINNNQAIIPYDSSGNIHNNNNSNNYINLDEANFDESLFEKIFDRRKELKIHQIKNSSLLYDINLDEFLSIFKKYEKTFFDKNKFITVFCEIIQSQTSEVFKGPMLRYSLSLLFQIIDIEKKNKLSFYEILGPLTVLTKARTEERLNVIFAYKPPELISIFCGILALYLNTEVIKDFNILSEIFIKTFYQMDIKKSQNFLEFIFGNKNEESDLDKDFDFLIEEEHSEIEGGKNCVNGKIIKQLNNMFKNTNFFGLNNFNIVEVTNKMIYNYSLLGQMNLNHINSLIDDLLIIKYSSLRTKEINKHKQDFLTFLEKFINFSKTELIDMTLLHSLFILIFSGSTLDKVRSIFIIHDLNESENIKTSDFCSYLIHMYYFMLKEIDFDENNLNILSNDLGKNIIDNISKGKDNLGFGDIVEFFDNVDFDIPSF